jgi:hypothetical protein
LFALYKRAGRAASVISTVTERVSGVREPGTLLKRVLNRDSKMATYQY